MNDGKITEISEAQVDAADQSHFAGNCLEITAFLLFEATLMVFQVFTGVTWLHRLGTGVQEDQVQVAEPLLDFIAPARAEVTGVVDRPGQVDAVVEEAIHSSSPRYVDEPRRVQPKSK